MRNKRDCVIGIDIGTQGTKAVLHDLAGRRLAEAFEASRLILGAPGVVEEDPERQVGSVLRVIAECVAKAAASGIAPADIACVAIDGQMAGVIGVGKDGCAVTPYDSWLDTRCAPYIAAMKEKAGDRILAGAGNFPSFNHGPKILFWKHERAETWPRIAAFVQPGGYAAMRLCGLAGHASFIDDTYLHFSGFADNALSRWNTELCAEFGVDAGKLPRIAKPAEIVGRVTRESAEACGLIAGTPVAAGLGDTAASFLSCGAVEPGICVDVAGTASVFAATTDRFVPDTASGLLGCGRSAVPGLWHPYAYINGGGMDLVWFSETIAKAGFAELDRLSAQSPRRDDDPYFLPHMEGRAMPAEPGMRGSWAGLSRTHGLGHLYRAILESVALEYRIYLEALETLAPDEPPREVRITGGGAKNRAWNRIKTDALGIPYRVLGKSAPAAPAGAPSGAAMVAAVACGLADNLSALASSWTGVEESLQPDAETTKSYRKRARTYRKLLTALQTFPDSEETTP